MESYYSIWKEFGFIQICFCKELTSIYFNCEDVNVFKSLIVLVGFELLKI